MDHHDFHQDRPFMIKEIFDQVSAVMWGWNNALDYYDNYIAPRADWSDTDIREESLYFAGLFHGSRRRGAPKPSQTGIYLPHHLGQQVHPAFRSNGAGSLSFQSQTTSQWQPTHLSGKVCGLDIPSPFPGTQEIPFRPAPPHHALSAYQPEPQHDTHANVSDYYRNAGYPQNEPHMRKRLSIPRVRARLPAQGYSSHDMTAGSISEQEAANVATVKVEGREPPDPFGILSVPDERTRFADLTDAHAPQFRRPAPLHYLPSGLQVEAREEDNAFASTVEDQPEESSEEDYPTTYTLSIKEETSSDGEFDEIARGASGQRGITVPGESKLPLWRRG